MSNLPVVVQCNGFVGSAMANAPDGTGVTALTVEATRTWAAQKAKSLRTTVDDRIANGEKESGK